jgi:hypothetical protein
VTSTGDGKADLLWRNSSSGQGTADLLLDGATRSGSAGLFTVADPELEADRTAETGTTAATEGRPASVGSGSALAPDRRPTHRCRRPPASGRRPRPVAEQDLGNR